MPHAPTSLPAPRVTHRVFVGDGQIAVSDSKLCSDHRYRSIYGTDSCLGHTPTDTQRDPMLLCRLVDTISYRRFSFEQGPSSAGPEPPTAETTDPPPLGVCSDVLGRAGGAGGGVAERAGRVRCIPPRW